ncbi:ankyrin repeat-containing protein, partial [Pestalotiopsis sp. NC0098]
MLQHKDYKVGWICALPKEQTAAIAMLDEEHEGLSQPPSDSNAYILGSIGGHNIVIACLPMGIYGTVTAATVAANMTRTFPAIRFGLMVGIGGGIPPKVRLGDVVSVPRDTHPGVVQWDMGKTEQGGTFRRTGALNNPPTLLLTALSSLESKRKFGKSRVQRYVEEIHLKFPDLDENYLKSDFLKDVLFDQGYPHQGEAINCEDCAKDRTIERGAAKFTVHYGTIASGNQVIKDAIFRESLVKDLGGDVLCIEMEAAGLMSNFPCIVIRGICDYADSHKNKAWQEHAAGVAAGFAKDLLGHIMVDRVAAEKAAKDVLSKVDQTVTTIGKVTTEMHQLLHNKEDMEVLNWLSLNHYGSEQSEALRRWHPGTCQWFLCSRRFQAWLENKGQALYCPGIPGAGKTTMSAAVIYDISCRFPTDSNVGIAYVYFAFSRQHEQTVEHVLASLLMQLLRRQTSMPDFIRKIHENHVKAGTRAMRGELFDALSHLIPRFKRAYIVLDALDECTTDNGCRKEVLSTILALRNSTGLSILVTSRPHEEIASFFSHRDSIPIRAQDNDVSVFLHSHLEAQDTDVFDGPIRSLVASRVTCVAEGMFLLARLHINTLVEIPTKKKVKIALEGLVTGPDGLHDVYEQTMRRIQSQGRGRRELAELILIWIVYARRPLSIRELQQALGVEPDSGQMDEDNIPSIKTLQSVCAGLVQVDEGSDMVGLIHYTTQEYFEKTRSQWFPDAQRYITQTCVAYLSLPNLGGYCIDARKFEERHEAHPFYDYAAQEWGHHARELSVEPHVIDFLQRKEAVEGVIQALMVHKRFRYNVWDLRNPYWSERFPKCMNGLHLAALLGLHFAVQALLIVFDVNDHDSRGRTPLAVAAEEGHSEVAELLLRTGSADVDKIDCYGSTALLLAAGRGHSDVFEMLVKTGKVDVNRTNSLGQTSLSMAAEKGYAHILKLLLDTGRMDVNSTDIRGKTPLVAAADGGHVAVAKLLLE